MAAFTYTARAKDGTTQKGTLYAEDRAAAAAALQEKGYVPILVKENDVKDQGNWLSKIKPGQKVKLADKVVFSRQFATMINAGVPIVQSLNILKSQTESKKLKVVITEVAKKVEGGSALADAMAEYQDIFTPVYVNMIRAGETAGILDQVLDRLATQQEKDAEILSKVRGAMIYPAVITSATVGAFFFLMTAIVPKLSAIFEGLDMELPVYTKIMLGTSKALTSYLVFILAGTFGGFVLLRRYIKTPAGKYQFDGIMLKLPIFGPIVRKVNVARFARTFGSLMASGVSVVESLDTTAMALTNSRFQKEVKQMISEVKNGKTVSSQLEDSLNFPPIVAQMIAVGEETGQIDQILIKLATFFEKEVDNIVSNMTSVIEPILIIVIGGMVGAIVVSIFGPLSNLSNAF